MSDVGYRKLIGKIEISGELECITGLHIGASKENMEIGSLDSPVVRDPLTNKPYIPGSSVKGKLRSFLEKINFTLLPNRDGGSGTSRHECGDWEKGESSNKNYGSQRFPFPGALHCPVCRLFGATGPGEGNRNYPARIKIRDLHLSNAEELVQMDTGLLYTEWKFENGIDRVTSAANPRNLERVPRGARFGLSIIYDVEDLDTVEEDLKNLKTAVSLLHDDALGGHGSRGYGQVRMDISQITAKKIGHYRGEEAQSSSVNSIADVTTLIEFFRG